MSAIARAQLIGEHYLGDWPLRCKSSASGRFDGRLPLFTRSLRLDF